MAKIYPWRSRACNMLRPVTFTVSAESVAEARNKIMNIIDSREVLQHQRKMIEEDIHNNMPTEAQNVLLNFGTETRSY